MPNERGAYRVREIADRWGCSVSKVHAMVRSGILPSLDLAGMVRIPAADLYAYEARCQPQAQIARTPGPKSNAVALDPTSLEVAARCLEMTNAAVRLHAGELTANEMRAVQAVLGWKARELRALARSHGVEKVRNA